MRGLVEVAPREDHTATLIWLHGLGQDCERFKEFLSSVQSSYMKTIFIGEVFTDNILHYCTIFESFIIKQCITVLIKVCTVLSSTR